MSCRIGTVGLSGDNDPAMSAQLNNPYYAYMTK